MPIELSAVRVPAQNQTDPICCILLQSLRLMRQKDHKIIRIFPGSQLFQCFIAFGCRSKGGIIDPCHIDRFLRLTHRQDTHFIL